MLLLLAAELIELRLLLLQAQVVEARLQHLHARRTVLVLRSLVLARDDDPGRQVRDPDGRVGDVDVLPAGAARSKGVDAQVLLVNLDVDVVRQLGPDVDRGERRVPARRLIERRNPHQPVDAGLGREQAVRVVADDRERHALDAGFLARLQVDDFPLEAAALDPPQVHAHEHLGPVLRLGAAGARMDRDDRVLPIHGRRRASCGLRRLRRRGRTVRDRARDPRRHPRPAGPVDQHREVVGLALERGGQRLVVFQPAPALQHLLRVGLVLPEVRGGNLRFEIGQLALEAGFVKVPSAGAPRVRRDLRTSGFVRQKSFTRILYERPGTSQRPRPGLHKRHDHDAADDHQRQPDDQIAEPAVERAAVEQPDIDRQRDGLEQRRSR